MAGKDQDMIDIYEYVELKLHVIDPEEPHNGASCKELRRSTIDADDVIRNLQRDIQALVGGASSPKTASLPHVSSQYLQHGDMVRQDSVTLRQGMVKSPLTPLCGIQREGSVLSLKDGVVLMSGANGEPTTPLGKVPGPPLGAVGGGKKLGKKCTAIPKSCVDDDRKKQTSHSVFSKELGDNQQRLEGSDGPTSCFIDSEPSTVSKLIEENLANFDRVVPCETGQIRIAEVAPSVAPSIPDDVDEDANIQCNLDDKDIETVIRKELEKKLSSKSHLSVELDYEQLVPRTSYPAAKMSPTFEEGHVPSQTITQKGTFPRGRLKSRQSAERASQIKLSRRHSQNNDNGLQKSQPQIKACPEGAKHYDVDDEDFYTHHFKRHHRRQSSFTMLEFPVKASLEDKEQVVFNPEEKFDHSYDQTARTANTDKSNLYPNQNDQTTTMFQSKALSQPIISNLPENYEKQAPGGSPSEPKKSKDDCMVQVNGKPSEPNDNICEQNGCHLKEKSFCDTVGPSGTCGKQEHSYSISLQRTALELCRDVIIASVRSLENSPAPLSATELLHPENVDNDVDLRNALETSSFFDDSSDVFAPDMESTLLLAYGDCSGDELYPVDREDVNLCLEEQGKCSSLVSKPSERNSHQAIQEHSQTISPLTVSQPVPTKGDKNVGKKVASPNKHGKIINKSKGKGLIGRANVVPQRKVRQIPRKEQQSRLARNDGNTKLYKATLTYKPKQEMKKETKMLEDIYIKRSALPRCKAPKAKETSGINPSVPASKANYGKQKIESKRKVNNVQAHKTERDGKIGQRSFEARLTRNAISHTVEQQKRASNTQKRVAGNIVTVQAFSSASGANHPEKSSRCNQKIATKPPKGKANENKHTKRNLNYKATVKDQKVVRGVDKAPALKEDVEELSNEIEGF